MEDSRHFGKCWKCYNTMDRLGRTLGGRIQPTPLPLNFFLGIGRFC